MDFCRKGRILQLLEAAKCKLLTENGGSKECAKAFCAPGSNLNNKSNQAMTKSLEVISEAIRNPKHPFRKVDNQPKKPQKHRYERRKIREYLHLGDWVSGEAT